MRLNTSFKLFLIFLSLSVAAPIAQNSEVFFAGNPIDIGIGSLAYNPLTETSSPAMGADLMAARRQRGKTRYRPSEQSRPSQIPHKDICPGESTQQSCQPIEKPTTTTAPEQTDFPDPWFDEPGPAEATAGEALGLLWLWNMLKGPSPAFDP